MNAKINQLKTNPDRVIENLEHFLSESAPGVMIKSFDGARSEIQAVFVANQREYHISSESFELENLKQVLEQTETVVRSFELLEH